MSPSHPRWVMGSTARLDRYSHCHVNAALFGKFVSRRYFSNASSSIDVGTFRPSLRKRAADAENRLRFYIMCLERVSVCSVISAAGTCNGQWRLHNTGCDLLDAFRSNFRFIELFLNIM